MTTDTLAELFALDPREFSLEPGTLGHDRLRRVITRLREARAQWNLGAKPAAKGKTAKAPAVAIDLDELFATPPPAGMEVNLDELFPTKEE